MRSLILQALRDEVDAQGGSGDPAKELVMDALKSVADRLEKLLEERHKQRIARAEQEAQDERDAFNEAMGDGQH